MDQPSHCFALNGDIFNPEISGVQGIVNCYMNSLQRYQLHGPTNFESIIKQVSDFVESKEEEQSQSNQKYNILMILTDGMITDIR